MEKSPRRKRLFDIVEIGNMSDEVSRGFDYLIVIAIVLNIAAMFLETFESMQKYNTALFVVEVVTTAIFIVEYILRIYTADFLYPELSRGKAILKFVTSFEGIVELLTIIPAFFLSGFAVFRMLRVVRILRLFRVNAYMDSFSVIASVIVEKKNQILSSVFIVIVLMLASSLCMYSVEHEAQPEYFKNAFSGIWWSMSTLLTIGYGDISPVTTLGRAMAIVISFLGVGAVAIPTGIISAGFVEQYTQAQQSTSMIDDIHLHTVQVGLDSRWVGKSAAELLEMDQVVLVVAKRGDITIVPNHHYEIQFGDELVVYHTDRLIIE